MIEKKYRIGEFAELIGVDPHTLRQWEKQGKIKPDRTPGGDRRYSETDYKILIGKPLPIRSPRKTVLYARVSSAGQKDDLERQIKALQTYATANGYSFEVYKDIGSGLNYKRRNFRKLLEEVMTGKVERIVVMYKDRLVRFGFELIDLITKANKVQVEIVNQTEVTTDIHTEMVEDMISIIQHFCSKLYGLRSHAYKKITSLMKSEVKEFEKNR
jgi:putative resolvase